MYGITAATGRLGRLVVADLLQKVPAGQITALVRTPAKGSDLAAKGVTIREADYDRPETLGPALSGIDKLLLISGHELGHRVVQHKSVIDAAKSAGVGLIAYTSVLRADASPLRVAEDHRQTEILLKASGVPYVLLRHGWYLENYTASIPATLQQGVVYGSSGDGRVAAAARADYAAAAAAVLTATQDQSGRVYELAGDNSFTLAHYAAELSRQSQKEVVYRDLPQAEYQAALIAAGLPDAVAALIAQSSACAGRGALFDDSHQLSGLIGRPTVPLKDAITAVLKV